MMCRPLCGTVLMLSGEKVKCCIIIQSHMTFTVGFIDLSGILVWIYHPCQEAYVRLRWMVFVCFCVSRIRIAQILGDGALANLAGT